MGSILRSIDSASITLLADYRSQTARDFGPLARHGTFPAGLVTFGVDGARFSGVGRIVHPDHVAGRNTTGSIVILAKTIDKGATRQDIYGARDAGGTRIIFYHNTNIALYDGTTIRTKAGTLVGYTCIAINYTAGTTPELYSNGVASGNFSGVLTPTANDAPITVGAAYDGTNGCSFPIACVLETSRPLTANEHAKVYAELSQRAWPAVPYCVVAPNSLVTSNRRGLVGSWNPGTTSQGTCYDLSDTGATGTVTGTGNLWVENSPLGKVARVDGAKSIDCGAMAPLKGVAACTIAQWIKRTALTTGGFPCGFFSAGTQRLGLGYSGADLFWMVATGDNSYGSYTVNDLLWHHLVLRFDGAGVGNAQRLRGWVDGQEVTLAYTLTIPATTTIAAVNWNLGGVSGLGNQLGQGGPCAVWNRALDPAEIVREYQRARPAGFKSDWGTPVSTAVWGGVVGTELEQTGWRFSDTTGRWWVDTSTIEGRVIKTMRCSTGGALVALYRDTKTMGMTPQEAAYGTWDISFMIPAAAGVNWHFISTISTLFAGAGGNNGYAIQAGASGAIALYRMVGGIITSAIKETAAGFLSINQFYRLRVTRDFKGLWTAKVLGGAYTGWTELPDTGAGPFVNPDNTYSVANYQVLGALTGLTVSLGDIAGANALAKGLVI